MKYLNFMLTQLNIMFLLFQYLQWIDACTYCKITQSTTDDDDAMELAMHLCGIPHSKKKWLRYFVPNKFKFILQHD